MSGAERYVFARPDATTLALPQHFRPAQTSPFEVEVQPERAWGYAEVFNGAASDGFVPASEAVVRLRGRVRATSENALISVLTDWRRFLSGATSLSREVTPGVMRWTWAMSSVRLTWAHPEGLPSEFADVLIVAVRQDVDAYSDLRPGG